jgi:hypothetical protein
MGAFPARLVAFCSFNPLASYALAAAVSLAAIFLDEAAFNGNVI